MSDLVAFVTARLDERVDGIGTRVSSADYCDAFEGIHLCVPEALGEVEAMRKILAIYEGEIRWLAEEGGGYAQRVLIGSVESCVKALAAIWSDHPDYDATWGSSASQ